MGGDRESGDGRRKSSGRKGQELMGGDWKRSGRGEGEA